MLLLEVAHPERIELRVEMAADPVGADDHQRADRVEHGALHLVVGELHALLFGLRLDLLRRALGLGGHHGHRPVAGQRRGGLVLRLHRPVAACPGGPFRLLLDRNLVVAEPLEEGLPRLVDRVGVVRVPGIHLLEVICVRTLHEGRGVEEVIRRLVGHCLCLHIRPGSGTDAPRRMAGASGWCLAPASAAPSGVGGCLGTRSVRLSPSRSLRARPRPAMRGCPRRRCPPISSLRSCRRRRPCRRRRSRPRGPCGGPEVRCGRR